jgi:hypothetical protein
LAGDFFATGALVAAAFGADFFGAGAVVFTGAALRGAAGREAFGALFFADDFDVGEGFFAAMKFSQRQGVIVAEK